MTRGDKVIFWVEEFCVVPFGVDRGQHVRLSVEQKEIVARFSIVTMHPKSRNRCRHTWHYFVLRGRAIWRCAFPQFRSVQTFFRLATRPVPICTPC